MPHRASWVAVALSGFIMVAAGAFAAHGLQGRIPPRLFDAFETGVRYQAWHTLAMLAVLVWRSRQPLRGQAVTLSLWGAGIVLFSGSLYLLALTGTPRLGLITPFGGLLLMTGWLALAVSAWRSRPAGTAG
ncbi:MULTISPECIES: DUF423 domain-containing protein [unclassified Modicisalibacter]|uniref:DUF423 domain-containing protein n=1 Tax=unclassified Modicisalibacter TaxID=2679913 RepID=UPI001CCCBF5B|nr:MULTISPECIES: DUF423 domain-containing protein [unclassified Modicisalibacter]MBZ9558831.1 DUF423 domain-containing protein [Modicisalibacter sp. R2A 31.J]MBZ9575277.1 DUF423 domain-containing protein [Modicisalibacter sp. MOD 31.J]